MELKPEDLVIGTWSNTPKRGWIHKPDTGIIITHIPTGAMVKVNTEKNIHRNKAVAMSMLEAKVEAIMGERSKKQDPIDQVVLLRKALQDLVDCYVSLVNSGKWNPEADVWVINARKALNETENS